MRAKTPLSQQVEPIDGANGANRAVGDMRDAKQSHVHQNATAKQHQKRSQNGAKMAPKWCQQLWGASFACFWGFSLSTQFSTAKTCETAGES